MFFGRRFGRTMRAERKKVLEDVLPLLEVKQDRATQTPDMAFMWDSLKDNPAQAETWFEIGYGAGEHLVKLLETYPEHRFIGCEPFMNGVSSFLKDLTAQSTPADYQDRLRLWTDSAEIILDHMPENSIDRLYLLNPDPWPKKRHHKRRFIQPANLDRIARVLKDNGFFITATDVSDLAEWMLEHTLAHPEFEWTAESKADWSVRPDDWMVTTRYAQKGADAGRNEVYLRFRRLPRK